MKATIPSFQVYKYLYRHKKTKKKIDQTKLHTIMEEEARRQGLTIDDYTIVMDNQLAELNKKMLKGEVKGLMSVYELKKNLGELFVKYDHIFNPMNPISMKTPILGQFL